MLSLAIIIFREVLEISLILGVVLMAILIVISYTFFPGGH